MRQVSKGSFAVILLALALTNGLARGEARSSSLRLATSSSAIPSGRVLLAHMRAALARADSAHLAFHFSVTGFAPGTSQESGYANISLHPRQAYWLETITSGGLPGTAGYRGQTIDVGHYRGLHFGSMPWVCALHPRVDPGEDDLRLGLKAVQILGVRAGALSGVPIWRVTATVTGPQHRRGRATFFIGQSSSLLWRLTMSVSVGGIAGDNSSSSKHVTGTVNYSAYGRPVQVGLPAGCHYVHVNAAALHSFKVEGLSMAPTLRNDQLIWINTRAYRRHSPHRRDIIVFRAVPAGQPHIDFIKRVIGLPGETVAVHNHSVYIDGHRLAEPYIGPAYRAAYTFAPHKVPENDYFVLGDNRNNSFDSSKWEPSPWLPRNDIIGKVLTLQ